jgi:hypothetical protein
MQRREAKRGVLPIIGSAAQWESYTAIGPPLPRGGLIRSVINAGKSSSMVTLHNEIKRATLIQLWARNPARVISRYRGAVGLSVSQPIPPGLSREQIIETIVAKENEVQSSSQVLRAMAA